MAKKRGLTKGEKCKAAVGGFLASYRLGLDAWALGLCGILILPLLVWAFYSPANDVFRQAPTDALRIFGYIFLALSAVVLVFVVKQEQKPVDFFSPFAVFALLSVILYLVAWVFYFAAYVNIAVLLFLTILPCTGLGCFAAMRRNYFALVPILIFFALQLSYTCIYIL